MLDMFLSVVLLASLDKGTVTVEHPQVSIKAPAVFGKPSSPTPEGVYLIQKGYSKSLNTNVLIFRRDDSGIYAIHPNLPNRTPQLKSAGVSDNYLSKGCIGVDQKVFDKLWAVKQTMVLQVY